MVVIQANLRYTWYRRICAAQERQVKFVTGDVILTVNGAQMDLGEDAKTELIIAAGYYYRNGRHFVVYDEPDTENGGRTSNIIKIAENKVEVIRRGADRVHMVFEKDRQTMNRYHTAVGDMLMDIYTSDISTVEAPELIETKIDYMLQMNDVFISKCQVQIRIMSKDGADLHILDRRGCDE